MSVKFRYPDRVKDLSINSSLEDKEVPSTSTESSGQKELEAKITAGLTRLVDFVRKHTKQKIQETDPEFIKKNKAIQAYKKTKGAA